MMLAAFELRISYASYPEFATAVALFAGSAVSFLLGLVTLRLAFYATDYRPTGFSHYQIDIKKLRRVHRVAFFVTVAIILMNLKKDGPPPIFMLLGADTPSYQEYGSLRQPLFTAILVMFVSAPIEPSRIRRWFLYIFAPACFLIYGSRGFLLIMMFQGLIVFSLRTSMSKKKIYLVALVALITAFLASDVIGNSRNSLGAQALIGYLQIKTTYADWPSAYLWVLSYISTPISNLCWIVHTYPYTQPSFSWVYSALPGFWSPKTIEQTGDLGTQQIIDGVHTYAAKYFIDFWYFGIFGINYAWGLISAFITAGDRLTRNYLSSAVLLGCMGFMFFSDFLTILIIMMELFLLGWAQRYFTIEGTPA